MGPFSIGFLMGAIAGIPAGIMALLTYQWIVEWRTWHKRDDMDATLIRLRRLQDSNRHGIKVDEQASFTIKGNTVNVPPDPRWYE